MDTVHICLGYFIFYNTAPSIALAKEGCPKVDKAMRGSLLFRQGYGGQRFFDMLE
jgi:hypothetical protein